MLGPVRDPNQKGFSLAPNHIVSMDESAEPRSSKLLADMDQDGLITPWMYDAELQHRDTRPTKPLKASCTPCPPPSNSSLTRPFSEARTRLPSRKLHSDSQDAWPSPKLDIWFGNLEVE